MSIIIAILVFGVIVVIHEFGHFIVARRAGILVEEFAIGMGPKLWGIKKGETEYTIRAFPIGGFCRMLGEDGDSKDGRAFNNKGILPRMAVVLAGAIMNFILAFVLFLVLASINGLSSPVVKDVMPGYPAEAANLQPGDKIVKINNSYVNIYNDLFFALNEGSGKPISVLVKRGSERMTMEIVPKLIENADGTKQYLIGFHCETKSGIFGKMEEGTQRAGLFETFTNSFWTILFYIKATIIGVVRLFTFHVNVKEMSGMIGIVNMIGTTYNESITVGVGYTLQRILSFVAFLSANLGVFNLLPLPALYGGRMVFLLVEAVRRKPVDREKEGMIHFAGFVLLMILAVYIAYNDIIKML